MFTNEPKAFGRVPPYVCNKSPVRLRRTFFICKEKRGLCAHHNKISSPLPFRPPRRSNCDRFICAWFNRSRKHYALGKWIQPGRDNANANRCSIIQLFFNIMLTTSYVQMDFEVFLRTLWSRACLCILLHCRANFSTRAWFICAHLTGCNLKVNRLLNFHNAVCNRFMKLSGKILFCKQYQRIFLLRKCNFAIWKEDIERIKLSRSKPIRQ